MINLFIEYTKDFPNFLIDNDTKYKLGEDPNKEHKDIVSTNSISTIKTFSSKDKY